MCTNTGLIFFCSPQNVAFGVHPTEERALTIIKTFCSAYADFFLSNPSSVTIFKIGGAHVVCKSLPFNVKITCKVSSILNKIDITPGPR